MRQEFEEQFRAQSQELVDRVELLRSRSDKLRSTFSFSDSGKVTEFVEVLVESMKVTTDQLWIMSMLKILPTETILDIWASKDNAYREFKENNSKSE